jgi:L-asparaginase
MDSRFRGNDERRSKTLDPGLRRKAKPKARYSNSTRSALVDSQWNAEQKDACPNAKLRAARPAEEIAMLNHLTIVTTGGTIDKIYFDDKSSFQIGAPQIGDILTALGVAFTFDVVDLMRKDSLHMDDADRESIRRTIEAQAHRHVLVTHGTDTMVETAQVLEGIVGKVIVLTGALNPARFQGSDAVFNVGCAVGAAQALPDGVYIAMNGRVWNPHYVRKNRDANRFEDSNAA